MRSWLSWFLMPRVFSFINFMIVAGLVVGAVIGLVVDCAFATDPLISSVVAAVVWFFLLIVAITQADISILWMPAGTLKVGVDGRKSVNDHWECRLVKGEVLWELSKAEPKVANVSMKVRCWQIKVLFMAQTPPELRLFYEMAETQHLEGWLNSVLLTVRKDGVPADSDRIKSLAMNSRPLGVSAPSQLVWGMLHVEVRKA